MATANSKIGAQRQGLRDDAGKVRLHKVLAASGLGSRRACEQMILEGLVSVNGQVVSKLPVLVDPKRDRIIVEGQPLPRATRASRAQTVRPAKLVYYLLNKPKGVICTNRDRSDQREVNPKRWRAIDLLPEVRQRLVSVGRLDVASRGLLIMTNDGDLVNLLTHPRYGVSKTYRLRIDGYLKKSDIERLKKGLWLTKDRPGPKDAQPAGAASVKIIHRDRGRTILEVVLREGRNRQIRRMIARLGYKVRDLIRIRIGQLSIKSLPIGAYRKLTSRELARLKSAGNQKRESSLDGKARKS